MNAKKERKTPTSIAEGLWLIDAMDRAGIRNIDVVGAMDLNTENLVSQWRSGNARMTDIQLLKVAKLLKADPYAVRPALLEYVELIKDEGLLLSGLPQNVATQILGTVALFRNQKPAKIEEKESVAPTKKR
ncbi:MAG: hypothetical protein LBE21_05520 [Pseudomonadales bacterium]|nr:hypothetical protein [Pseudomonadales bacterium]